MGLAIPADEMPLSCALECVDCSSRFCKDSVSEVASSKWSKFVLSSNEMSELQKLSPECAGYASGNLRDIKKLVDFEIFLSEVSFIAKFNCNKTLYKIR